ncbi:serine carboxypeptidase [Trametes coccinea BRFM310]|uniref:Serine carboxypeptidase n=1 Tax=Trametes coccinea (strain BRFM310) TaxID=1353009 RepID=A0A1Y2J1M5_TRAC3|nr:serine carboxypeptidase [Trametes coccinea BRFM310]
MFSLKLRIAVVSVTWIASVAGSLIPRAGIPPNPTPGKLRVVENSGVCETTPGVYQASGYGDLSSSESMWFWFFESRHEPDNAPLTLWLEGGRGTSSMRGLFQENGPCRLNNDSNGVSLNPYSWNEVSNVLYIDQPVGVGFSYGDENVYTGEDAAAQVWRFLQIFLSDSRFAKYQKSDFGIWTELYGASYAAVFGNYFLSQNSKIANGTISGLAINLKSIGVGGGVFDPLTQYPLYEDYVVSNPYAQLISAREVLDQTRLWFAADNSGIQKKIQNCYQNSYEDDKLVCWDAVLAANQGWVDTLYGHYNPYYVRSDEAYPPSAVPYLSRKDVQAKIGALSNYSDSNALVAYNLEEGGTWLRNHAQEIADLINQDIPTLFWAGDADFYGNYMAQEILIVALPTKYQDDIYETPLTNYNVNGHTAGQFVSAGTFSYVRVTGAGHRVGAYGGHSLERGQAALQFFNQTIHHGAIFST